MYFLKKNGIPSETIQKNDFWIKIDNDRVFFKSDKIFYEIENLCVKIHDLIAEILFDNLENFNSKLPLLNPFFYQSGLDSECSISKVDFEKEVSGQSNNEIFNKMLYLFDVRNLVSSIQNSNVEIKHLFGSFYKHLNDNSFLLSEKPIMSTGIQYAAGSIVTNIYSTLNSIIIKLNSQLDFTSKLAYEIENIHTNFKTYPRLKSKDFLYGNKRKLKINELQGTLFEGSEYLNLITTIRNEIIHNSSYYNQPKVYQRFDKGILKEKFILLPDMENGRLTIFKNRRRFFNSEIKFNEILPEILTEFWNRLHNTLDVIINNTN